MSAVRDGAGGLDEFKNVLRELLRNADVVHFDETGFRVAGSLHWVHSASTQFLTDYYADKKRGRKAMDKGEVLPSMKGIAVHDGLRALSQIRNQPRSLIVMPTSA
jgi:hypothetical protein